MRTMIRITKTMPRAGVAFAAVTLILAARPASAQMEPMDLPESSASAIAASAQGIAAAEQAVTLWAQAIAASAQDLAVSGQNIAASAHGVAAGSSALRASTPAMHAMAATLPAMTEALSGSPVRIAATGSTLRALDAGRAGPPAGWAQQDPADSLYRAARAALNRGDNQAAARLFGEVVSEHPDSEYAPDALYWRAFALYRVGDGESLRQALAALERQADAYPDAATRGDAQALAVRVRGALAQRGDADAAQDIAEAAGTIADGDDSSCERGEDHEIRVAALNALMHMDEARALPIARRVLERRDACSADLREKAVFVISRMDSPQTADILVDIARNDPSIEVQKQAVFWLSNVEGERTVDAISDILRNSPSQELRESAVFALSRHDSQRAAELLRSIAAEGGVDAETREKAIFWLSQNDSEENTAFLRSLYGQLRDTELREQTLFAISRMGGEANYDWLLERALDEDASLELRKKALFWAGRVDEARVDDLVDLYDRSVNRELKEQLIFVYSRRDEPQALDKMIEIAREEDDVELRKKAIFWLSRSDDPRAVEVLQDIISR